MAKMTEDVLGVRVSTGFTQWVTLDTNMMDACRVKMRVETGASMFTGGKANGMGTQKSR